MPGLGRIEEADARSAEPGTTTSQRVLNGQPSGRAKGCGTMPRIEVSRWPWRPAAGRLPSRGTEPSRARV